MVQRLLRCSLTVVFPALAIVLIAGTITSATCAAEPAGRGTVALQTGPEVTGLGLSSTSGNDLTTDSLVCGYTPAGTATTTATAWYVNSLPMMIVYLPMEGGTVNSLLDYSGGGNNGTAAGDPTWLATGGFDGNGCYDFDGNDHIDLGNIMPAGPYTKVAWVYYIPGETYNNIISGQSSHAFWVFSTAGAFRLTAGHNGTWDMVADPDPFPANTWVHTAVTYDGDKLKLYRNGAPVDSATGIPGINSDTRAYIGSFTNSCCWIRGCIDDARIYDFALSGEQIAALYGGGAGDDDLIVPQETAIGEEWQACVTPFSATEAGATSCTGTLTILALPEAPVITSTPVTTGYAGELYTYDVEASGHPAPFFELTVSPAGMAIDSITGEITWVPATVGDYDIEVSVSNAAGDDTQAYILSISEPPPCPLELTHYWKLDENPGPPYADEVGGNDATCTDCPAPVAGTVGGAQHFDGLSDEVYAPNDGSWDWDKDASFSICYWMRTSASTAGNRVLVARDDAVNGLHIWVGCDDSGRERFQCRDVNGNGVYIGNKGALLNDGDWHFIVAVRDNSADMNRIYVDGVKVDSVYYDYTAGFHGTAELNIGYIDLSGHYRYEGDIDEVATFDKALSDAEILAYYDDGLIGTGYCEKEPAAPVIVSEPDTLGLVGQLYTYDVDATGLPAPTFDLLVFPAGMTIDPVTGEIEWTPAAGGDYTVEVEASNTEGTDTQSFTIHVSEPPPCPADMISYWKLDETGGATYYDFYDGNHGAASPSPPTPSGDGIVGTSQEFNGSNNYITVPDNGAFDWPGTASFTIECWCRFTDVGGKNKVMVGRDDGGGYPHWWLGAQSGSGTAAFNLLDRSKQGIACYGAAALNNDVWHHLVAVRDESVNMNRLYVDGAKVDSAFYDYADSFEGATQLDIGYMAYNGTPDYFYHGKLDEVATYNDALTGAEIAAHYANGLAGFGYCEEVEVPPEITSTPVTAANTDELYTYNVDATGYPAPHYALLTYPAGMVIDSLSGLIEWTPPAAGDYDVLVEAYNVAGTDNQSYQIAVTVPLHPELEDLLLEATSAQSDDDDDLLCGYLLTGSATTAATAWYVNEAPIMVLYLPMEGGAAEALVDYSGGGGGGGAVMPNGDPVWSAAAGHDGHGAFVFDGNDDLGAGECFPLSSSYTKTAWVYRTGSGANGGNNIISGDANEGGHAFWAPDHYGNVLSAGHNEHWDFVQDGEALALDTWYFVALSYDYDSGLLVLYKNGAMVDSGTVDSGDRDLLDTTVSIGSFGASNGWMWQGTIDEPRVYNRALSAGQIAALYAEGSDFIDADETDIGEQWRACVTPFSAEEAGSTYCTDSLVINEVVATLLHSFDARLQEYGVTLEWRLVETGAGMRFFVLRSGGGGHVFEEITQPEISRDGSSFFFWDGDCGPGGTYRYRVDVQDEDGRRMLFETGEISVPVVPLTLHQNYPNPFNPMTAIRFVLPEKCHVKLSIFDARGRHVRTLVDRTMKGGFKEVSWDGTTKHGDVAGSGVYFYRLKAGSEVLTRKMLLLR